MSDHIETIRERLLAWCDDVQLSARLGTPHYANPSELKADIRALVSQLAETDLALDQAVDMANDHAATILALEARLAEAREALDWIEAEPEDPARVQARARDALARLDAESRTP